MADNKKPPAQSGEIDALMAALAENNRRRNELAMLADTVDAIQRYQQAAGNPNYQRQQMASIVDGELRRMERETTKHWGETCDLDQIAKAARRKHLHDRIKRKNRGQQ
jgi:hypothetical protein